MKKLVYLCTVFVFCHTFAQTEAVVDLISNGDKKLASRDFKAAVSFYTQALNRNPRLTDVYLKRAEARKAISELAGAIADYDKAIALKPVYALYYQRGLIFQEAGKNTEAAADFSKTIALKPDFDNAFFARGLSRFNQKEYKMALSDFSKSIDLNPQNPRAYFLRGICKVRTLPAATQNAALPDLEMSLKLKPNKSWEDYNRLAYSLFESQIQVPALLQKAELWAATAMEMNKNIFTTGTYAQVLLRTGKLEQALQQADAAMEIARQQNLDVSAVAELKARIRLEQENQKLAVAARNQTSLDVRMPDKAIRMPRVWAVVIGVARYKNPKLNLKFADNDAQAFYGFLRSPAGGNIPADRITLLTNERATRSSIIRALNERFNRAFEDDVIMLYIASHGQTDPVSDEVYFLGYDTEADNLSGSALSQTDIEKSLTNTRAKKKVWIADACHSGIYKGMEMRANAHALTNKLLNRIAVSNNGMALLTASSNSEFSFEDAKWGGGHGVFTYHLLQGLKGKADANTDTFVTIRELYEYVYRGVADDTAGQQHPELKGNFDNKMPIGIVK
jgi:tetratricopeptide (TPR) repeat protein/uncharacterized caspase-like protein